MQTIRACLYKVISRGKVSYFTLLVIISNIQRTVNKRSLTYCESSNRELETITLNMFLRSSRNSVLLLHVGGGDLSPTVPLSRGRLIKAMELRNDWLDVFQHIRYNDYLVNLRERSHGRSQVPFRNLLKVNDLVLVRRPLKPFLETVLELFRCDDGVIRSVCIKQGDGSVQVHSLKYPCLQTSKVNL